MGKKCDITLIFAGFSFQLDSSIIENAVHNGKKDHKCNLCDNASKNK